MARDDRPRSTSGIRRAARLAGGADRVVTKLAAPVRKLGFPYRAPSTPRGVEVPDVASKLSADFETDWARKLPSRYVRALITHGPLQLGVRLLADPVVSGLDRLDDLRALDEPPPLIFAPNHHSHLDTPLMVTSVPEPWRSRLVVAAAADYFFDSRLKGTVAALALNALPIDREATGRKSSDQIRELIDDRWSLVIYPEGGRSPDGWGQDFKGGAAYLASRTGAAVVPVFIDGSGAIFGKGMRRPRPGRTKILFGVPMRPTDGETTRRFNARIEAAVTMLADETLTDFWTARRRAAVGASPRLTGPDCTGWRRQWALTEQRELGAAGLRHRRWPDLG